MKELKHAEEVFMRKVQSIQENFKTMTVAMMDKHLHSQQVIEIWNGRKFKKKVTQWKQIKIKLE